MYYILCCPALVPQMAGGAVPLGFETVKMSVKHLLVLVTSFKMCFPVVVVAVDGPVMTKLSKSSLN